MYVCMRVYVCMCVCVCVCVCVCMYVCMHVCMYVCMYVCIHIHISDLFDCTAGEAREILSELFYLGAGKVAGVRSEDCLPRLL